MGVEVDLFLFGKPEWEMNMEEVSASEIREKGEELKERLHRIAEIMEKLENAGWERAGASLYSISFYKDIAIEDAKEELRQLGIDPEEVGLMEIEEEDEEIEDADFVCEDVEDAEDAEEVEDADVGEEWREGERLLLLEDFELPRKAVGGEREESVWKGRRERAEGKSEEGR
ncbi:MAG: hypothetical protein N2V73_04925 [Candidatus Methanospirare jalkutatii]|nr:hypothetical protein [Candidatus Methanospirare jalkutatii]MCW7080025.1 hypothetical protein [Candidatus Methanospirare jalkutatii]